MKNISACFITFAIGLCLVIVLFWLLGGITHVARAQGPDGIATYYVAPGMDCGGMTPCFSSVQAAVDAADAPDDVVKVAGGSYTDVNTDGGLSQAVFINKTVTVRGGYTTSNWSISNPIANPTILDAQGKGRVIYITGDISPTVEGLNITGGSANGWGYIGGGLYIISATATISNCTIYDNVASTNGNGSGNGGGLALKGAAAIL